MQVVSLVFPNPCARKEASEARIFLNPNVSRLLGGRRAEAPRRREAGLHLCDLHDATRKTSPAEPRPGTSVREKTMSDAPFPGEFSSWRSLRRSSGTWDRSRRVPAEQSRRELKVEGRGGEAATGSAL